MPWKAKHFANRGNNLLPNFPQLSDNLELLRAGAHWVHILASVSQANAAGGRRAAAGMTAEQRSGRARKAADARWGDPYLVPDPQYVMRVPAWALRANSR